MRGTTGFGGLAWLVIAFAILTIVFGVWGFAFAAAATWAGIKVLFWVCLVLFILSLLGSAAGPSRAP